MPAKPPPALTLWLLTVTALAAGAGFLEIAHDDLASVILCSGAAGASFGLAVHHWMEHRR